MIPICFVWDELVFYSAIDHKPKKVAAHRLAQVKNIRDIPQVALLLDQYDEDWTRLWYVLVRGKAELVSTAEEQRGEASYFYETGDYSEILFWAFNTELTPSASRVSFRSGWQSSVWNYIRRKRV